MGTQELLKPKYLILIILSILLVLYAMYQARFLIQGPQIVVTSHQNGFSVGGHLITIEGLARNASWLSLNDRQIFTDESGAWSERVVVPSGGSVIKVRATDRFGRETTENIQI